MRIVVLIALAGLMQAARSFAPNQETGSGAAGTALAVGYLLLFAFFLGDLCSSMRLPRLTGYLLAGIIAGPSALDLVSGVTADNLRIFNGVAIALIALTAGVELDLRELKPLFRSIRWLIVTAVLGGTVLLTATAYFGRALLPFMSSMSQLQLIATSVVLGVTMVAQSPAVVVALRSELAADGPLTRTVLGVVVMSDLVVVLMFAIVSTLAKVAFGAQADAIQTAMNLAWEILGSLVVGLVVGAILWFFLKFINVSGALFVVVAGFIVAEVGQRIDLDPLIVALAAGLYIRNLTSMGPLLLEAVESASLPVYVIFFAVTGAAIRLTDLKMVGVAALLFAGVRATGFIGGTWIGAKVAGAPAPVGSLAAFGLIPQAGLALALTLLMQRTFPSFGNAASTLVFATVAINQLIAPVLFRIALVRSGEAGKLNASGTRSDVPEAASLNPVPSHSSR